MNASDQQQHLDAWLALTRGDLGPGETVRLPVLSGSMLPDLPLGALLEIEPIRAQQCRIGDVVVFQETEHRLTAHRIIACWGIGSWRLFLQKGDNNPYGALLRGAGVRGRVRFVHSQAHDAPGPFDPANAERARRSRRTHFRNLILYWPRRVRDLLQR